MCPANARCHVRGRAGTCATVIGIRRTVMITRDSDGHATSLVMQSFATEQDAMHAVAALREAGFSAAAIGVEARNAATMAHVARATGVVPITAMPRGAVVGRGIPSGRGPAADAPRRRRPVSPTRTCPILGDGASGHRRIGMMATAAHYYQHKWSGGQAAT